MLLVHLLPPQEALLLQLQVALQLGHLRLRQGGGGRQLVRRVRLQERRGHEAAEIGTRRR